MPYFLSRSGHILANSEEDFKKCISTVAGGGVGFGTFIGTLSRASVSECDVVLCF